MVNLRRAVDKRLRKEKPADYWPMFKIWRTAEAFIANIVELSLTLQDDGYSEIASIKKLLSGISAPLDSCAHDLASYIRLRLEKFDPEYLALGPEFLDQAVELAKVVAAAEIKQRNADTEFPPLPWLKEQISYDSILNRTTYEQYPLLPQSKDESREWIRFQLRMKPDDEIWTFSGSLLGNGTSLRAGVALLRQGKVIDHVCTVTG